MDDLTQLVKGELGKVRENVDQFCASQKTKTKELTDKQIEIQNRLSAEVRTENSRAPAAMVAAATMSAIGGGDALRAMLEGNAAELRAVADRKVRHAVLDLPGGRFEPAISVAVDRHHVP